MNQEQVWLQMLIDSLEQKISALEGIVAENEKQKNTLEDPNGTPDEFELTITRKQVYIDKVTDLDNGFEAVFNRVRPVVEQNRQAYKAEIQKLQDYIRSITDLSSKIRAQEQKNYTLAQKKFSDIKSRVKKVRKSQSAVNRYYTNMMKINHIDPQFLDDNM